MYSQFACTVADSWPHVLKDVERQLRWLLPADLYAAVWIDPSSAKLMDVFEHLRTLQHILIDYVPRAVSEQPPEPGCCRYNWHAGTLMFTDLAGFTPLLEARATEGLDGAELLLKLINNYFSEMLDIVGKSSGTLLEFTGDALLVEFTTGDQERDIMQAVKAGLRMQRAMEPFQRITTPQGELSLTMRVGIHTGQFVKADIGTPQRMAHVLLGRAVTIAKRAEGLGTVGQVSLTQAVKAQISDRFPLTPIDGQHWLAVDDLAPGELGEYDITVSRRRSSSPMLFDRSVSALLHEIQSEINTVEPLATYLPRSVLQLVVDTASARRVPPAFPTIAVAFVNLMGLPESVDDALPGETAAVVACFSKAFSLINGAVELRGGILQKVTYHSIGSEMLIHFGVLNPDPKDPLQAAAAMGAVQELVTSIAPPTVRGKPIQLTCRIGLTYGPVFAAEIGERRGRREFNILGDTVNTAARLMSRAGRNEIWMNQAMHQRIQAHFHTRPLGNLRLKGKTLQQPVYVLANKRE